MATDDSLDFEDKASYTLTLGVKDNKDAAGNAAPTEGADDTIVVTINLTDVPLPPAPESPSFSAGPTDPASERLVRWTSLVLPGGEAVTDYDVQYRVVGAAQWTDHPFDGTGLSTTITGLASNTEYEVQVRAVNVEGPGPWSMPAKSTTAKAELTVVFGKSNYTVTEGETATITVTVTPAADRDVSVTVITATEAGNSLDVPDDTLALTIARGEDSLSFEIVTAADAGGSELTLKLATTAVKVSVGTPGVATLTINEPPNSQPTFNETGPAERTVPENSAAATNVGAPFTATDSEGDLLAYSLAGPDSDKFIMDANGQIAVGADVDLDFEAAVNSYTVTAQVTDSQGPAGDEDATIDDTIAVTIKVTDMAGPATVDNGRHRRRSHWRR